jgi:hypothetical protein
VLLTVTWFLARAIRTSSHLAASYSALNGEVTTIDLLRWRRVERGVRLGVTAGATPSRGGVIIGPCTVRLRNKRGPTFGVLGISRGTSSISGLGRAATRSARLGKAGGVWETLVVGVTGVVAEGIAPTRGVLSWRRFLVVEVVVDVSRGDGRAPLDCARSDKAKRLLSPSLTRDCGVTGEVMMAPPAVMSFSPSMVVGRLDISNESEPEKKRTQLSRSNIRAVTT